MLKLCVQNSDSDSKNNSTVVLFIKLDQHKYNLSEIFNTVDHTIRDNNNSSPG